MLLVIDIGNTNVVFGLYDGETLTHTFRMATVHTRTEDEYGALLLQLLQLRGLPVNCVECAILASVVPPLTDVMIDAVRSAFAREPLVVGPGLKTGIPVLYENPRDVGADRVVNAVAAFERYKEATIVVDFGTATTFDCISPKGEYLGGVIVPGMRISLDALLDRAAKLSRIELSAPPRVLGRNTTHALQSGLIFGHASMVDGMIERLEQEAGYPSRVIATGGLSGLVSKHARRIEAVDVNLTLEGLRILHERNVQGADSRANNVKRSRAPKNS
ncbi:MAG TPA: type III pantothenate kinase [Polyangiaceae bacterium]|nr:type III pantothenate kinase [Polyangiaceae bacterium]